MNYEVALGGVKFDVPSLPFRLVKELQPGLLGWIAKHDFAADGTVRLTTADLSELADLVFRAVAHSPQGKVMSKESFEELPIGTLDLARAVDPIMRACGLRFEQLGEGAPNPKA